MVTHLHLTKPSSSASSSSFFSHRQHCAVPVPPTSTTASLREKISEPGLNRDSTLWVRSLLEELSENRDPNELLLIRQPISVETDNNSQRLVSNPGDKVNVNSLVLIESSIVRELNQLYSNLGTIIRKLNDEMINNNNNTSELEEATTLLKEEDTRNHLNDISITITSSTSFASDQIPTRDIDIIAGVNNQEFVRQTFHSSLCDLDLEGSSDQESRLDIDFSGSYLIENNGKKLKICQQPSGSFNETYKEKYLHQLGRQLKESYTKSAVDEALDLIKQHQSNIESNQSDSSDQVNNGTCSANSEYSADSVQFEHIYRFISEKLLTLLAEQRADDLTRDFSHSDSSKQQEEEVLQPDFSYSTTTISTNTNTNITTDTTNTTTQEDFVINEQLTMVAVGLQKKGFKIPRRNRKRPCKAKRRRKTSIRPDGNEQGEPCPDQNNTFIQPSNGHHHQEEGDRSWYASKHQIYCSTTNELATSTSTSFRVRVCESMEPAKLRDIWSRLHKTGLNHPDEELNKELQDRLGVENLLRASNPAKCCRPAVLNERQLRNAPYSPSLRSLPLELGDLAIIEESLGRSLERCSNSTDLHKDDIMTYYINLDKENVMSYYINLVNYREPLVVLPKSPPVYQIMHFTVSGLVSESSKQDATTDVTSSFCLGVKKSFCLLKKALFSSKSLMPSSSSERRLQIPQSEIQEPRPCGTQMQSSHSHLLLKERDVTMGTKLERIGKRPQQYKTDLIKVTSHIKLDVSSKKLKDAAGKPLEASASESNKNVISVFQVSAKESTPEASEIDPSKLVAVPPDCKLVIVVKCTESNENVCEYMVRSRSGGIETVGTAALQSDSSSGDALKPQNIQVRVNGVPVKMDLDDIEEADMGNILICLKSTAENDRIEILMQADDSSKSRTGKLKKKGNIARRIKQCPSREVTTKELNNQRPKKPSHPQEEVSLYLKSAGMPKLVKASRPASCARNNLINARPLKKAPYSASLNSLPLNITDLAIIEQSYAMAVGAEGEGKGGKCWKRKSQIRDSDDIKNYPFILTDSCKCKPPPETPTQQQEVRWFVVNDTAKEEAAAPNQPQAEAFPFQRFHLLTSSEETPPEMVNASTQLDLSSIDEFLEDLFEEREEDSESSSATSEEDEINHHRWSVTNVAVSEEDPQITQDDTRKKEEPESGSGSRTLSFIEKSPEASLAESDKLPGEEIEEDEANDEFGEKPEDEMNQEQRIDDVDDGKRSASLDVDESDEKEDLPKVDKPQNDEPKKKDPQPTNNDKTGDKNQSPRTSSNDSPSSKDQSTSSKAPNDASDATPQDDPEQASQSPEQPKDKKSPCCDKATCCNVPEDRGVQSTTGESKSIQCGNSKCNDCQYKKKEKKPCTDDTCQKKPASKRESSKKCGGKCCHCCDDDDNNDDGSCATCPKCKKIKEVLESVKNLKCTCKHQESKDSKDKNYCGKCGKPKNNQKERTSRRSGSAQKYVTVSGCSEELLEELDEGGGDAKTIFDGSFNYLEQFCCSWSSISKPSHVKEEVRRISQHQSICFHSMGSTTSSPPPLRLRGGVSGTQQDITYATVRNILENNLNASGHHIENPSQSKAAIDYVAYLVYKQIADGTVSGQVSPAPSLISSKRFGAEKTNRESRRSRTPSPRRFTTKQDSPSGQDEILAQRQQRNREETKLEEEEYVETGTFNKCHRKTQFCHEAARDERESKGYVCNICNACVVNLAPAPPEVSTNRLEGTTNETSLNEKKSCNIPATTTSTAHSESCGERRQGAVPRSKSVITPSASSEQHQHQHPHHRALHCHQMEAFSQHLHSCKLPVWSRKPEQRTSEDPNNEVTRDTSSRLSSARTISFNKTSRLDPIEFTATVRRDAQAGNDDLEMTFYAVRSIQVQTDAEEAASPSRNKEVQVSLTTPLLPSSRKFVGDSGRQADLNSLLRADYFKVVGEKRSSYDFSSIQRSTCHDDDSSKYVCSIPNADPFTMIMSSRHGSRCAEQDISTCRKKREENHSKRGSYGLLDNLSDLLEKSNAIVDCYVVQAEGKATSSNHSTPPNNRHKSHHSLSLENFEQEINSILYNADQPDLRSKLQEERLTSSSSSDHGVVESGVLSEATFRRLSKVYKEALWLSYQCNKLLLGHETQLARGDSRRSLPGRQGVLKAGDVFALGGVDSKERSVPAQTLWALTKVSVHPDGCKEMEVLEVTGNDPQKYKMFCFTE